MKYTGTITVKFAFEVPGDSPDEPTQAALLATAGAAGEVVSGAASRVGTAIAGVFDEPVLEFTAVPSA